MSETLNKRMAEDEMSLNDIIDFFLGAWKIMLISGILGIAGSAAFLLITPKQYEATALIQMAQTNTGGSISPFGVNVEDPNVLLARMKSPGSYSAENFKICGLEGSKSPAESLSNAVNFSVLKGVNTYIELSIRMESKEQAVSCVNSIFERIRDSQNQILKPYIEEAKIFLAKYQARLVDLRKIIAVATASKSGPEIAHLDEVKLLTDETIRLDAFIAAVDARQSKIISPIYASETPVYPKKRQSFVFGLLGGLFFGLALAVAKKTIMSYHMNN